LIERDQAELAGTISYETGKSLNEARAEVIETLHMIQWTAGSGRTPVGDWMASEIAGKDAYVMRKPKGIVLVISPWNFPCAIGGAWTTGPALIEGNCVIHKPSELTPATAQFMAQLYCEAGFPDGVYNLVHGDGKEVGYPLIVNPEVDCILFTGSAEVGQIVRKECANSFHKSCSTETGSKSATILFEDGNQDLALEVMTASAFKLTGQRCVSSGRLLVQRSIFDKFAERFVSYVKEKVTIGDPFKGDFYCGPMISERQRKRVIDFNDMTVNSVNAKVLMGGAVAKGLGYFLSPHIYTSEWNRYAPYLSQEVFGPHVALIPFNDTDDAISIYNDTEYGLAVGVITDDFRRQRQMRDECRAGMIYINGGSVCAESHLPFGGVKKSGNGCKSAAGTYKAVTDEVAVTVNFEKGMTWAQGLK
jgi:aldehyde dehydrogenase (NAD+)